MPHYLPGFMLQAMPWLVSNKVFENSLCTLPTRRRLCGARSSVDLTQRRPIPMAAVILRGMSASNAFISAPSR